MLNHNLTPKHFWAKTGNTTCYLQNIIYIRPILKKNPYELWKGQKNPTYHTSIHLDVNVSFITLRITWESLTLKVITGHFLDTQKHIRHSEFTTQEI